MLFKYQVLQQKSLVILKLTALVASNDSKKAYSNGLIRPQKLVSSLAIAI